MDVAEYRKLNKPGWVIQAIAGNKGAYVGLVWDSGLYTKDINNALAFNVQSDAFYLSSVLTRTTTSTWRAISIPNLPKEDNSGEIKKGLEKVVGDIVEYETVSLNHYGIASNLYNLIVRIVKEQTTDD